MNQILEAAFVPVLEGKRLESHKPLHFYVDHQYVTYEPEALTKFGTRLDDRKPDVEVLKACEVRGRVSQYLAELGLDWGKVWLGGKNVANFDLRFLRELIPDIDSYVKHRSIDIGNLFFLPHMQAIPDLATCLKMAKVRGFESKYEVTHTALDDALVCVELYEWWYNGRPCK